MMFLIGIAVVFLSVGIGYTLEGGALKVLLQPAELLIIGGAAVGSVLISTPTGVLKLLAQQSTRILGSGGSRADFLDLLTMQYQLFKTIQQSGVMALEPHFDAPEQSVIMSKFPGFLARHEAVNFLSDSAKVIIMGGIAPHDLEALMDEDLDILHEEAGRPAGALAKIADALPGLGIVAAVLGVVITMQAIDGPPSEIGEKVGAALVGTFLGILLSYGFAQPIATKLEHMVAGEGHYLRCIKTGLLAAYKGFSPAIAVEFARRVLPNEVRPSFEETEKTCRGIKPEAVAA
jgi:chemotaxis protein MotA